MLYALKPTSRLALALALMVAGAATAPDKSPDVKPDLQKPDLANPALSKPDLQKVYNEALNWSKAKVDEMPDIKASNDQAGFGGCVGAKAGEPLSIKPPCSKKQDLNAVVDKAVDKAIEDNDAGSNVDSTNKETTPKILVFVSFSMPRVSLKELAESAPKHNAVLVMRGLKDDSFKDTQQAFLELIGEGAASSDQVNNTSDSKTDADVSGLQGFEVNPELFKVYEIKHVPVFVLVKGDQELGRLSGNVSMSFAAEKLRESI